MILTVDEAKEKFERGTVSRLALISKQKDSGVIKHRLTYCGRAATAWPKSPEGSSSREWSMWSRASKRYGATAGDRKKDQNSS